MRYGWASFKFMTRDSWERAVTGPQVEFPLPQGNLNFCSYSFNWLGETHPCYWGNLLFLKWTGCRCWQHLQNAFIVTTRQSYSLAKLTHEIKYRIYILFTLCFIYKHCVLCPPDKSTFLSLEKKKALYPKRLGSCNGNLGFQYCFS